MLKQVLISLVLLFSLCKASVLFALTESPINSNDNINLSEIRKHVSDINGKLIKHYGDPGTTHYQTPTQFQAPALDRTLSQLFALIALHHPPKAIEYGLKNIITDLLIAAPNTDTCKLHSNHSFNELSQCSQKTFHQKLIHYGKSIPITMPYPQEGKTRSYNYSLGSEKEKNNFLLSPSTLFGHEIYGNLAEKIKLPGNKSIDTEKQAAQIFLDYLLDPLPAELPNRMNIQSGDETSALNFIVHLRNFTALKAFFRGNIEEMIHRRVPLSGHQSQLSIEKDMATRRIKKYFGETNSWYNKMEAANPVTVNREVAYLLAEMNYQLYLNRQIQERMLATMSAIGAASTGVNKPSYEHN